MDGRSSEPVRVTLERKLPRLHEDYGIVRVQIYGSLARGEERAGSDVDLLVEFEGVPSLFDIARLQEELEALLGRDVDITTPGGLHPRVLKAARADAVELGTGG